MSLLNSYETIYILKPDVTDTANFALINSYKALLKEKGGLDIVVQHRGRRHLSYNISHYYDGIYVQMNYLGNGKLVRVFEKSMRLNDNILRYTTVKKMNLSSLTVC
uniref:Small ribosomal subunit protein bS6c n=1 Tax=Polysiphonia scopulorum TaxID=257860 RepID=A0A1Z1MIF0_9FLOR|nr:ribosomal protein S6 [Polysiphonia scopulorum]ARW65521.1 ribosomal protein S6 [Polysiphonia scopulorum]